MYSQLFFIGFILLGSRNFLVQAQRCRTPNNASGQCLSIYSCGVLYRLIESGLTDESATFLRSSQCPAGSGRPPYVCCGPNDPFLTGGGVTARRRRPVIVQQSNGLGNVLPDYSVCGRDLTGNKIYGGSDAEIDEFPWMALLEYENNKGERDFACGGVLINQRYVLTVAHCLTGEVEEKKGALISVRLGEYNLDTATDCVNVGQSRDCAPPPLDIPVEEVLPHREYSNTDINRYNDIGLVRLASNVGEYTDFVRPICLPPAQLRSSAGWNLTVSGWGRTLTSKKSSIKQKLGLVIQDFATCRTQFARKNVFLRDAQLCAGGQFAEDTCDGDSGGPLMRQAMGIWFAEGLVSFGNSCGLEGWPGVYTRVTSYISWIQSTMRP